jgi:histidinol-phosphatase (PHP family)
MPQRPGGGILVDYHTHPRRTPDDLPVSAHAAHFRASMQTYAARAAALGLAELGFSEHIYRLSIAPGVVPWRNTSLPTGDMGSYVRAVEDVKAEQAGRTAGGAAAPVIRLSMEVDIVPSTVSILEAALPLYPFDYILGSVHTVPDLPEGAAAEDAYTGYYAAMQWAARSGLFHSIAHPDRIHRKLGHVDESFLKELMAETARTLASNSVSVEMSSNGVHGGLLGVDPHETFVRLCLDHGITATLGSDAHRIEVLGQGLPEVRDFIWRLGYREIATFDRGRRIMRPLQAPTAVPAEEAAGGA